jgi:hypothetical protein
VTRPRTLGAVLAVAALLAPGGVATADPEHPRAACAQRVNDAEGDGKYTLSTTGNVKDPRDPSVDAIDVTSVTLRYTGDALEAHLRLKSLAGAFGTYETAYRYDVTFASADGTTFLLQAMRDSPTWGPTPAKATGSSQYPLASFTVGATTTRFTGVTAPVDVAGGWVVISVPAAELAKAFGTPVGAGTTLTGVSAQTYAYIPGTGAAAIRPADVATSAEAAQSTYTVGDDYCFGPPPASLATTLTAPRVAYGDGVPLSATLTSEAGTPLAGKPVRFAVAGEPVRTATTGANGVATVTFVSTGPAGAYPLTISFDGDATDGHATFRGVSVTVVAEKTRLAVLTWTRTSATARTVTTVLSDDDGHVLAGQKVEWWVNGKRVTTTTTTSRGKAAFTGAKAGQSVVAKYAGVTGKYVATVTKAAKV